LIDHDYTQTVTAIYQSPAVQKAVRLYQEAHAMLEGKLPALPVLIDWLLDADHGQAANLEERMGWIRNILVDIGEVLPDDSVGLCGADILLLRIFADTS
jgi:hypothetical protein